MAEEQNYLQRAVAATGSSIKESLGVRDETQGFGNIMGETFTAANIFGADSFLGKTFSSEEDRDRARDFGKQSSAKGKEKANIVGGDDSTSDVLKATSEDVAAIREISEEEYTDPKKDFDTLPKSNKALIDVNNKILAAIQKQKPAGTEVQGDEIIERLDILIARIGMGGGMGGGGRLDFDPRRRGGRGRGRGGRSTTRGNNTGNKSKLGNMLKGKGGLAAKAGGAVVGVGLAAYGAYKGVTGAEESADALEISAAEEQKQKASAVGEGVGMAGGAAAGAAIGSMIFPGIGTLVGGAIGAVVGGMGGKAAGEEVAETIEISDEELAESNQKIDAVLAQAKESKNPELVTDIEARAKELEGEITEKVIGLKELDDASELSDNDKQGIINEARIQAINEFRPQLDAAGIDMSAESLEEATAAPAGEATRNVMTKSGMKKLTRAEVEQGKKEGTIKRSLANDALRKFELDDMAAAQASAEPQKKGMEIPDGPVPAGGEAQSVDMGDGLPPATFDPMQGAVPLPSVAEIEATQSGNIEETAPEERRSVMTKSGMKKLTRAEVLEGKKAGTIKRSLANDALRKFSLDDRKRAAQADATPSQSEAASTPASAVETATDAAAPSTEAPAPIVIPAPAANAPAASPDVNVIVSVPKSIGPNNATGNRYVASVFS